MTASASALSGAATSATSRARAARVGERRVEHIKRLRTALDAAGQRYVELRGPFEHRRQQAIALVGSLLSPGRASHANS